MSEVNFVNADPTLVQNLKGHRKLVTDLSFHPDGNQFASSSLDHSVMLWNLALQHKRCYSFMGHSDGVTCVQFSSNGQLLASGSQDQTVRLWVPSIKGTSADFKAHSAAVRSLSFAPGDKQLITGSNDKSIKMWDVQRRHFLSSFTGHNNWVRCVRFSPDGNFIASCADDRTLRIWDAKSGQCVHVFTGSKGSMNYLAVHSNGKTIAIAMNTGTVRLYDIRAKKLQQHYSLHNDVTCVAWHPLANYLLTSGDDQTMKIVDVMEGRPLYTLKAHEGRISAVTFTNNGDRFASTGFNKHIMIWNTNFISRVSPSTSTCSTSQESV